MSTTTTRAASAVAVAAPSLLSLDEAAEYLNVSVRYMRRLVADRRIRHRKVGHYLRFDARDLDAFVVVREAVPR